MARKAAFKFHKLLVAEPALSPDARARELYPKAERHAGHGAARAPSKTTHPTEPRSQLQRVRRIEAFEARGGRISGGGAASRYTKQALAAAAAVVPPGLPHSRGPMVPGAAPAVILSRSLLPRA